MLSPSKEGEPPVAAPFWDWALHFLSLTAGRRGLYSPGPVGGAWPGSPCCVWNSTIIAERVFKHYQLCPVFPIFPFVLKVDQTSFPSAILWVPYEVSDSGLNSIYDKISPTPSFFFFLAHPQKPKTKKANDLSCSETSSVSPKAASL